MQKMRPENSPSPHGPKTLTPAPCFLLTPAPVWWQGELDQLTELRNNTANKS